MMTSGAPGEAMAGGGETAAATGMGSTVLLKSIITLETTPRLIILNMGITMAITLIKFTLIMANITMIAWMEELYILVFLTKFERSPCAYP